MTSQKRKSFSAQNQSPVEQLRDLGTGIVSSVTTDVVGGVAAGILENIFAPKKNLQANEEIIFSSQEIMTSGIAEVKPVRPAERTLVTAADLELAGEIENVRAELKKTVSELRELNTAIAEVEKAVAQAPVKAGKYHFSFFAKLRMMLRLFRQQVSQSRVWLEESFARKKKRGYWQMFKKHGTSFSQSSELAIASQAG